LKDNAADRSYGAKKIVLSKMLQTESSYGAKIIVLSKMLQTESSYGAKKGKGINVM